LCIVFSKYPFRPRTLDGLFIPRAVRILVKGAAGTELGGKRVCLEITDATLRTLPVHRLLLTSYARETLAEDAASRGFYVLGQDTANLWRGAARLDRAIVGVGDSDWK
jgi:hypothetical protein